MKNCLLTEKFALPLSFVAAAYYELNCETSSTSSIAAKVISTALLAYQARSTLLHKSFLSHCVGDLLIELGENSFLPAIGTFFLGHGFCLYALKNNCIQFNEISFSKKLVMISFGIYAAGFTYLLSNKTDGVIQTAIPFYSTMLTALFITACLQKEKTLRLFLGALFYITSDNIIGANLFLKKLPGSSYISWPLYFLGQNLMLNAAQKITNHRKTVERGCAGIQSASL